MDQSIIPPLDTNAVTRRCFVQGIAAAGVIAGAGSLPRKAFAATSTPLLTGPRFDLEIGAAPVNITGRRATATVVNGTLPAPILRWQEGDTVTLAVTNRLSEPTSIHWHGIRSPSPMDGVPGLSFPGIAPGETFTYRIPVHQSGTYWYHSHSGFQEQTGLYGAIVVDPKAGYAQAFDRDYVVLLSDWSDVSPETIVSNLKFQSDYYNYGQRTAGTFINDVANKGLSETVSDRLEWGKMRMSPTDILDVNGSTYTYLINGQPPSANWTALFKPGERVRLRFINGSSMSIFDVRIPGLTMTVVQTDGNDVWPVEVDEFRIGTAETYDVIVQPRTDQAFTIFAQAEDRSGFARGTLTPRTGLAAAVPSMDQRPMRTMADMGMAGMEGMAGMGAASLKSAGGGMGSMQMGGSAGKPAAGGLMPNMDMRSLAPKPEGGEMPGMKTDDGAMPGKKMGNDAMPSMKMGGGDITGMKMDHGSMGGMFMENGSMPGMKTDAPQAKENSSAAAKLKESVEVDNVAMMPQDNLQNPGEGSGSPGRRVLSYNDLRALKPGNDPRPPSREITLHLTGNMQRFIWGFNGKKFSEAEPIELKRNERVRFVLINDSMMEHPIHLHGLWSELENGQGAYRPYKHTVLVKPGERISYLVTADEPGRWAYHCHLLYHMEMGMFREVHVA